MVGSRVDRVTGGMSMEDSGKHALLEVLELKKGTPFALGCALIAQFALAAHADVAPDPLAGGASMINSAQKTNIAMNSEVVAIKLTKERCFVNVVFDMRNTSTAEELEVGFPCNYDEEMDNFSAVVDGKPVRFKTEEGGRYRKGWGPQPVPAVFIGPNGRPLPPVPAPKLAYTTPRPYQELGFSAWKTWKMFFGDHARHRIEISYNNSLHPVSRRYSRPQLMTLSGEPVKEELPTAAEARYVLRTGAFWKGPIGRATVNVICEGFQASSLLEAYPFGWQVTGNKATLVKTNFEPDEDVSIVLDTKVKNAQQGEKAMMARGFDYQYGLYPANCMLSFYVLHSDPVHALSYADTRLTERIKVLKKGQSSLDLGDVDFVEKLVGLYSKASVYPQFKALAPKVVQLLSFHLNDCYTTDRAPELSRIKRIQNTCKHI
jgi:hypothetical protein